jgi:hypothetical protein
MAMDAPRPELVVAIDFGMTCTDDPWLASIDLPNIFP